MKKILIIILLLVFSLSLSSCSRVSIDDDDGVILKDLLGRELSIKKGSYKRVLCIGAGALRLYTYIAFSSNLCGVEDIDNLSLSSRPKMFDGVARPYLIAYSIDFLNLPSCGVGGPQSQVAEIEKILNCNPDIIISEYEDIEKANNLSNALNIPVVVISIGKDGVFDEKVKDTLTLLGKIFDKEDRALSIINYINSEKADIENRVKDINEDVEKKVYISGLGNWGTANHLSTAQNYAPFKIAKINNIVRGLIKDGIQSIDDEKFLSLSPSIDIMILDAASIKNIKTLYQDNPHMFDTCKAWNDGEVYLELAYNAYYTNLEISLANTWFNAKVVYPSLFSDIDIKDKLDEITEVFLGKRLSDEIYEYEYSYSGYSKLNKAIITG